jgi:diacylglycerol kinase
MLKQFAQDIGAAIVLGAFVTMMSVWMMVLGG